MSVRVLLPILCLTMVYACTQLRDIPEPQAPQNSAARDITHTDILVLGDSQISFGAGASYTTFFNDLAQNCRGNLGRIPSVKSAAIGVRSTALHHWTAVSGHAKGAICDVDPTYGVNAGSYGITSTDRSYVQIGADPDYPFCKSGRSPLQAVFDAPAYDPDLIVLSFLGNATDRWQSPATARTDWRAAHASLPPQPPCLVMTTIPTYLSDENDRRVRAQRHLQAAVDTIGTCAFVPGITPATRARFEGNAEFFRTDAEGAVSDPRHPTAASAAAFLDEMTPALCSALSSILPN